MNEIPLVILTPAKIYEPYPITSVVLKVAAGCNLNCSYCYEYNMGDDSWKRKPAGISDDIVRLLATRIRDHVARWGQKEFTISLHGGEPMLLGAARISHIVSLLRDGIGDATQLNFGMQTNGTLLDDDAVRVLNCAGVQIGVSLDGDGRANDLYRVDRNGNGSHARATAGIEAIRRTAPEAFGGILCVINELSNPAETLAHLASFNPPVIDFLLPHGNWDRMPPHKDGGMDLRYGRWLCAAFDAWFDGPFSHISVRYFESLLAEMMGGHSTTEAIGPGVVTLLTIATDGAMEGVDTMKSVYPGAQDLKIKLDLCSFDDALKAEHLKMRQCGLEGLCDECKACKIGHICGGGYFPHRFGNNRGFHNPSVYCHGILMLAEHMRLRVKQAVSKS